MSPIAHWLLAVLAVLSLATSSCASRTPAAAAMGFSPNVWTEDGLYLVQRNGPGALFLAQPPPGLRHYDSVILEDVQLSHKEGAHELLPILQTRAMSMIRRNMLRMMSTHGWQIVDRPGPNTLRARVAVFEVDIESVYLHGVSFAEAEGSAAMVVELRDSVGDRRLLVYGQNRSMPFGSYSGPGRPDAQRLADAFFEYSIDLFRLVDQSDRGELSAPVLQLSRRPNSTR